MDLASDTHAPPTSVTAVRSRRGLTIALYAAAAFLYWMALYLYVPTLPVYVQSKSDSLALVGLVLSMYGLWQAVVRLPLGITADWVGWRKPFILVGIALAGLGAWVMATTNTVGGLLIGRSITGLGAATWVPLVVVFSAQFAPGEAVRASAMLTLAGSLGRILATGVTGSLNDLGGYSLPFSLAAAIALVAVLFALPAGETRRPPRRPSPRGISALITRRDVLLPALLGAIIQYANYATTYGFLPILARQLGAGSVAQSLLVTSNLAVYTLGNLVASALAARLGGRRLSYLSFALVFVGLGGAAFAPSLDLAFAAQLIIGLGVGIGYPVFMGMSIEHVQDAERATAMGLHQAVYAVGMFGGPWLSGILADILGIQPMFGLTAVACLALGLTGAFRLASPSTGVAEAPTASS